MHYTASGSHNFIWWFFTSPKCFVAGAKSSLFPQVPLTALQPCRSQHCNQRYALLCHNSYLQSDLFSRYKGNQVARLDGAVSSLEGGVPTYNRGLELRDPKGPFQPNPFYDHNNATRWRDAWCQFQRSLCDTQTPQPREVSPYPALCDPNPWVQAPFLLLKKTNRIWAELAAY